MSVKLFVGNLPYNVTSDDLEDLFGKIGEVVSSNIITDRITGQSRGFGFVEMNDDSSARQAISTLNGADFMGKNLDVNEARPRTDAPLVNRSGGGFKRNFNN